MGDMVMYAQLANALVTLGILPCSPNTVTLWTDVDGLAAACSTTEWAGAENESVNCGDTDACTEVMDASVSEASASPPKLEPTEELGVTLTLPTARACGGRGLSLLHV